MSLEGIVKNGVVILDNGHQLPEGTRVEVIVRNGATSQPTLAERLLKHAGTVPDLPPDLADQHDHYRHGTPKR
jgi:hypothetical protein